MLSIGTRADAILIFKDFSKITQAGKASFFHYNRN